MVGCRHPDEWQEKLGGFGRKERTRAKTPGLTIPQSLLLRADRAILVDSMHGDDARIVVSVERMKAGGVNARVDGARGQRLRYR